MKTQTRARKGERFAGVSSNAAPSERKALCTANGLADAASASPTAPFSALRNNCSLPPVMRFGSVASRSAPAASVNAAEPPRRTAA